MVCRLVRQVVHDVPDGLRPDLSGIGVRVGDDDKQVSSSAEPDEVILGVRCAGVVGDGVIEVDVNRGKDRGSFVLGALSEQVHQRVEDAPCLVDEVEGDLQRTLGRNLRAHRQKQGLGQEQFAERLGYHRTYIGGIEQGLRNLSLRSVERLALDLNVDPLELLRELSAE